MSAIPGRIEAVSAATPAHRVLVVDDHPVNRELIGLQIRALGHRVDLAADGACALARWTECDYALMVVDCVMPEMDGFEVARRVREIEAASGRSRTPIVACTANAGPEVVRACKDAGMDGYLGKPCDARVLAIEMGRLLGATAPTGVGVPSPAAPKRAVLAASGGAIDLDTMAAAFGTDPAVLREVLEDYAFATRDDMIALRAALGARDAPLVARAAHRIGGASRMVGAIRLSDACARLERAARAGDWVKVDGAAAVLDQCLEAVESEVRSLLQAGG